MGYEKDVSWCILNAGSESANYPHDMGIEEKATVPHDYIPND